LSRRCSTCSGWPAGAAAAACWRGCCSWGCYGQAARPAEKGWDSRLLLKFAHLRTRSHLTGVLNTTRHQRDRLRDEVKGLQAQVRRAPAFAQPALTRLPAGCFRPSRPPGDRAAHQAPAPNQPATAPADGRHRGAAGARGQGRAAGAAQLLGADRHRAGGAPRSGPPGGWAAAGAGAGACACGACDLLRCGRAGAGPALPLRRALPRPGLPLAPCTAPAGPSLPALCPQSPTRGAWGSWRARCCSCRPRRPRCGPSTAGSWRRRRRAWSSCRWAAWGARGVLRGWCRVWGLAAAGAAQAGARMHCLGLGCCGAAQRSLGRPLSPASSSRPIIPAPHTPAPHIQSFCRRRCRRRRPRPRRTRWSWPAG
jgi:hypothetical protein